MAHKAHPTIHITPIIVVAASLPIVCWTIAKPKVTRTAVVPTPCKTHPTNAFSMDNPATFRASNMVAATTTTPAMA